MVMRTRDVLRLMRARVSLRAALHPGVKCNDVNVANAHSMLHVEGRPTMFGKRVDGARPSRETKNWRGG
jgi:hypothetical protein